MTGPVDEILLAVGRDDCDAALAFVAAEVGRRGGQVKVAHAILPLERRSAGALLESEGATVRGVDTRVLDEAVTRIERVLCDVPVRTELLRGVAARALVRASRTVRRVVLQRSPGRHRVPAFSTTSHVAAHAHVPVVVVPPDWHPDAEHEARVVVGVDDVLTSMQLVDTAFAEASARNAQLVIVHAWFHGDPGDDLALGGGALQAHHDEVRANVERELAPTLARHPAVRTTVAVRPGRPAEVLVAESARAGLLVLGRHVASVPWGSHLGSVVRAVLRHSESPVLVLDAMAPRRRPDQMASGAIEMAPEGHSAAQMPQPLQ